MINPKAFFVSAFYTDKTLKLMLRDLTHNVLATHLPFWLFINGYDADQRHLWTIPEVKDLSVRLVKHGFLSVLELNPKTHERLRGWTAYELWLCSRGELTSSIDVRRMLVDLKGGFMREVCEANQRCANLVSDSIN